MFHCGQETETFSRFLWSVASSPSHGKGIDPAGIVRPDRHPSAHDLVLGAHRTAGRSQGNRRLDESPRRLRDGIAANEEVSVLGTNNHFLNQFCRFPFHSHNALRFRTGFIYP